MLLDRCTSSAITTFRDQYDELVGSVAVFFQRQSVRICRRCGNQPQQRHGRRG